MSSKPTVPRCAAIRPGDNALDRRRWPERPLKSRARRTVLAPSGCAAPQGHHNLQRHPSYAGLTSEAMENSKVCIVRASGKLGQYMVQHCLDRGYEVVGVCRPQSVEKLDRFKGRISIVPGATNDREVIKQAVTDCWGVLTVLAPWGVNNYSSGTAQAVLDLSHRKRAQYFLVGGTFRRMARTCIPRPLLRFLRWSAGLRSSFASLT